MSRHGPRNAQALTEFALVVPIFLLLLFGVIDLGRYVYTANSLNNGAREAARAGSVSIRPDACTGLSRQACAQLIARSNSWGVPGTAISVSVTCERIASDGSISSVAVSACRSNDLLTVRATTPFTLVTPLVAQFLGSLPIEGKSVITVNQ